MMIGLDDSLEAHYVCGVLNSSLSRARINASISSEAHGEILALVNFDKSARRYKRTTLVLKTPLTVEQVLEQIKDRRQALAALPPGEDSVEGQALREALQLNPAEEVEIRDEPAEIVDRPDDALLNRLAQLEQEAGEGALVTLRGVFGKESADVMAPDCPTQTESAPMR